MGRVFVAGSINMDVVATADRHPRIGETVAGSAVLYFPAAKARPNGRSAIDSDGGRSRGGHLHESSPRTRGPITTGVC
jgi:ribokinase